MFHRIYKFIESLPDVGGRTWPADIKEELAYSTLLMAVAHSNIRWPVCPIITATDATPSAGGAVSCEVSNLLAKDLFRCSEYRGRYVRLDGTQRETQAPIPHSDIIDTIAQFLDWDVFSQHAFAETSHVNLQEIREIALALKHRWVL